jgi:hypothetical protein
LHYAFDMWMAREFPDIPFERYVDDAVVHCVSERQARRLVEAIGNRMEEVGLRLHPAKTRIVYCKDANRRGVYAQTSFTFLGFTFRARAARSRHGATFRCFLPAVSKDALKRMSVEVRSWRIHRRTRHTFVQLARFINPIVRGWIQYYGAYYRSAAGAPPAAHQRLSGALDPPKVQAARGLQEGQGVLPGHHTAIPRDVLPLAVCPPLLMLRVTRAV